MARCFAEPTPLRGGERLVGASPTAGVRCWRWVSWTAVRACIIWVVVNLARLIAHGMAAKELF